MRDSDCKWFIVKKNKNILQLGCAFAVTRPTQLGRCRHKIFYWGSKSKIFFMIPKHFLRQLINLTLSFTFQMHIYILLDISITRPSLHILGKTQTGVFPISGFLVHPL